MIIFDIRGKLKSVLRAEKDLKGQKKKKETQHMIISEVGNKKNTKSLCIPILFFFDYYLFSR